MKDNSGCAFPSRQMFDPGMSLRDYFAAAATDGDVHAILELKPQGFISRQVARYMHADAMLIERAKP